MLLKLSKNVSCNFSFKNERWNINEIKTNRTAANNIFDKRFQDNIYNQNMAPKAGFVDFSDKNEEFSNKSINFTGNYNDYLDK